MDVTLRRALLRAHLTSALLHEAGAAMFAADRRFDAAERMRDRAEECRQRARVHLAALSAEHSTQRTGNRDDRPVGIEPDRVHVAHAER